MTAPVRLEDIEEFELVCRIPRSAITEKILEGVSKLHEPDEIEPFLRDILIDRTETPHTSTEIADILTTHVTHLRQPCLTAFVNKGKSYPKVTAKEVTHQLYRLRQIRSLELIVLLAVGDIYDDAKRDFLQIAEDANVDYMIVDAIDVARLFIAYHKICPKDGTPYLDSKCRKCGTPASEPIELTLKVHDELRYNILYDNNVSHVTAKRYKADILTDPHYSKAALREVVRRATWELCQRKFYSSEQLERHFDEQRANYIFLFVYLDLRDKQQTNWVCCSSWIRSDLPEGSKQMRLRGNDWLGEIEIGWNPNYQQMRDHWYSRRGKKEDWVQKVDRLFLKVEAIVQDANRLLKEHREGQLEKPKLPARLGQLESESRNLFQDAGNPEVPALECAECDSVFQSMMCKFRNIFIDFATREQAEQNWEQKLWMMEDSLKMYEEDKDRFRYERRKIGRL